MDLQKVWESLTPDQQSQVLVRVFGPDFPMREVERIMREPTMAELAQFGPELRQALNSL